MKETALQAASPDINQLQAIGEFGIAEIMTMKETLGKKLTIPQFNLFMYQMNRMGLDPSLKHAFPIPYGDTIDIRIAYEGFHAKAQESEGYLGVYNQVICENEVDDFEAIANDEGIITSVKHRVKFPRGKVVGAYSIAKREGRPNVVVLMDVSEVQKWVKKNPTFWKLEDGSIDPDMFKKHAGTRAIKAQYDIAAVVEDSTEALNSGGPAIEGYEPQRRDITAEVEQIADQKQASLPQTPGEDPKLEDARQKMAEKFQLLGIADKKAMGEYISKHAKPKGDKPTLAEMLGLLKIMDMHIEEKRAEGPADLDDELAAELG